MIILIIILALGIGHVVNWLLAKGVIWVVFELFNVNWHGKFWVVYLALIIIGILFRSLITVNKGD